MLMTRDDFAFILLLSIYGWQEAVSTGWRWRRLQLIEELDRKPLEGR